MTALAPPAGGLGLRVGPNAVLATAALLALQLNVLFGALAVLAFLGAGLLLWVRWPGQAATDVLRFWPIHLVAGWCVLSTFWSAEPGISLRLGVQLALTGLIAVAMATRLSPRTFLRAVFWALVVAAVASVLFGRVRGDGAGWLGIYGSKNEFSFAMSTLVLAGLALALDRRGAGRLVGLGGAVLGAGLLVLGQSAGALVSTAGAVALGLALVALRPLPPAARALAVLLAVLLVAALVLVALSHRDALAQAFLQTTGKDVTLTGRTDLWAEAWREIRARPLLGQGFRAVWVPGNPVAEAMWDKFGIAGKAGFHFHNTWISNAVEIGVVGVAIQAAAFGATLALVGAWVGARATAAALFFAMFMGRQAVMSLVEVVAYLNFDVMTVLTVAALVYGLRVRAEAGR